MNFKKATIIAAIGTTIELIKNIAYVFIVQNMVEKWYSIELIRYIDQASHLFFLAVLSLFFVYLILNQKRD